MRQSTRGSLRSSPFLPLALALVSLPLVSHAQVVINEVLYDPEGPDAGLEFVELRNCGRYGVSLAGWVLESGNGAGPDDWTVEWIGGDLDYVEAGAFFLIGESSVVPTPDYVTSLDLQNGPDGVRLTDGSEIVDVVGWGEPLFPEYYEGAPAVDAPSGSSLARTPDCFDHDANAYDFAPAAEPTPGFRNALAVDLAVRARHAGSVILPEDAAVDVAGVVANVGSSTVEEAGISLVVDGAEVASAWIARALEPRDSVLVTVSWDHPTRGYHSAELRLPPDEGPGNDASATSFTVGRPGRQLVLNEIMHSPDDGGTEWVELLNPTSAAVCPSGWLLGDEVETHAFDCGDSVSVGPGAYLVVARDPDNPVLASVASAGTDGWEALSADDVVTLADAFGTPIDAVAYQRGWGGGRGVSLERVRPDMPTDDPSNWGGCVDPGGATPGRRNSIFLDAAPPQGRLSVAPNPFSPNGDGSDDRAAIRYELPTARATVRLSVYDALGRRRVVLVDRAAASASGEVLWDGADASGTPLPSGLYVVRLEAINAREGTLVDETRAVGLVR
jgi:hypothetical protein